MKFIAIAIAALVGAADAATLKGKHFNKNIAGKLMQNAKVHQAASRKLDQNEFEITGEYSVIFNSCESLTVQANFDQGGDDNGYTVQNMYSNGQLKAQRSYILFDICPSSYCYTDNGKYHDTYITDMASFIDAFAEFIPQKQEAYCEGCNENMDYCMYYNQDSSSTGGTAVMVEDVIYEYINCDRCQAYGCFSENREDDGSVEWIRQMTECAESENPMYYEGQAIRWGFMCDEDGDGVEVAAFLDEDCTLYTNQVSFGSSMSNYDYYMWSTTKQSIEYMFSTQFSCYDPEITYINPYDEEAGNYDEEFYNYKNGYYQNNNGNNAYEVPEAAEWCRDVFDGEMDTVSMNDCGYNYNENQAQEEEQEEENNNGYYVQQTYTLSEEMAEDGYSVCTALNNMGGSGEHLYETKNSGSLYTYGGSKTSSADVHETIAGNQKKGINVGATLAVIVVLLVIGGVAAFYVKSKSSRSDKSQPMLSGDGKGQMA